MQEAVVENMAAEQARFIEELLSDAATRAEEVLACPIERVLTRTMGDDGFSKLDRLELSPFVEDQLLALALRLASDPAAHDNLDEALVAQFRVPPTSFAVEAQRRAVFADAEGARLPMEAAHDAVESLACRLERQHTVDPSVLMERYAALYADFWCNPRIGAPLAVRRVMLAMVSLLYERSAVPMQPELQKVRRHGR